MKRKDVHEARKRKKTTPIQSRTVAEQNGHSVQVRRVKTRIKTECISSNVDCGWWARRERGPMAAGEKTNCQAGAGRIAEAQTRAPMLRCWCLNYPVGGCTMLQLPAKVYSEHPVNKQGQHGLPRQARRVFVGRKVYSSDTSTSSPAMRTLHALYLPIPSFLFLPLCLPVRAQICLTEKSSYCDNGFFGALSLQRPGQGDRGLVKGTL